MTFNPFNNQGHIMKHSYGALCKSWIALSIAFMASGCAERLDDLPREAIQGKVTIDGEPLERGAIRFRTVTPGPAIEVGELIRDGQYQIAKGQGPVPGKYTVMITEETDHAPDAKGPFGSRAGMKKSRIPAKYNRPPGLTAEVKKDHADPVDFALTTK